MRSALTVTVITVLILITSVPASAADAWINRAPAANVILPLRRVIHHPSQAQPVKITAVNAVVSIHGQRAVTTVDVGLRNPQGRMQEAELIMPVPTGAIVTGLDFQGKAKEPQAKMLSVDEARQIYRSIVSKLRDPALMEFVGYNLIRSSVFPVPANGNQTLRLVYEQVLERNGQHLAYRLPRSTHFTDTVPWTISVSVKQDAGLASVFSPSHHIDVQRDNGNQATITLSQQGKRDPGPFILDLLLSKKNTVGSVIAYPDGKDGGYFMLLAGAPQAAAQQAQKRDISLVIDRSGSMNGDKIEQVRAAAKQIIGGLSAGEYFNIVIYHHGVESFAQAPVPMNPDNEKAARAWLDAMRPRGGTNIHDALLESLRQTPVAGTLPITLFLTDGIATVGQTQEAAIRDMAKSSNPHKRRIFTIGVGEDVNTHLLEKLADHSRATAEFIFPGENIEVKVARVYERLTGPVLSDLKLQVEDSKGVELLGSVIDVLPGHLGDLFAGQQLVITGRYTGQAPRTFMVSAKRQGKASKLVLAFDPAKASVRNDYVARLWASRKIGELIDHIRSMGAAGDPATHAKDPRFKELVADVVKLSTEFGILTEYTAFLARDGSLPINATPAQLEEVAARAFNDQALRSRYGRSSLAQSHNSLKRKSADKLTYSNDYLDADLKQQNSVGALQPFGSNSYYKRGQQWCDNHVLSKGNTVKPDRTIAFASDEYFALAEKLAVSNRQQGLAFRGEVMLQVDAEVILVK